MNENKSINSLKKQLVAAVAMVCVAAVALGSSTYAWFAANNKVQATGMEVTAVAEGGIEIAYGKSTDSSGQWGTVASAGMTKAATLLPTSTDNTASGHWYHASAESGNASAAKVDTYTTLTLQAGSADKNIAGSSTDKQDSTQYYDTTGNQYFCIKNFVIRSTATADSLSKGLKVDKVSVSGASADMSKALRVAVKVGNRVLFYAPVYDIKPSDYDVYSGHANSGGAETAVKAGTVQLTDKNTVTLIGETENTAIPAKGVSTNGGVDCEIYIYFEGEDSNLYSQSYKAEGLKVTVDFSATV